LARRANTKVKGVFKFDMSKRTKAANPVLNSIGDFMYDPINVAVLGRNQPLAQKIFDRVGWK
jgi:hypothetical protein